MKPLAIVALIVGACVLTGFTVTQIMPGGATGNGGQPAFERVKKTGVLRCAYATWPPAMVKDMDTGELSGINYDVMQEIGKELSLKIEWTEEVGFGEYIQGLDEGRYDALCSTQWPDPDRIRFQTFTRPYYFSPVYAYVRANDARFDGDINKINDPNVMIATIDSDISVSAARIDFPKAKQYALPGSADAQEMFLAVTSKRADVYFSDEGNFLAYERGNPGKLRRVRDTPPSRVYGEVIPLRSGEIQLRDMLNVAIMQLIDSGKIEAIINKHAQGVYFMPTPSSRDERK